jgi:hypothetical protein
LGCSPRIQLLIKIFSCVLSSPNTLIAILHEKNSLDLIVNKKFFEIMIVLIRCKIFFFTYKFSPDSLFNYMLSKMLLHAD